jgi:beta-galactosidase
MRPLLFVTLFGGSLAAAGAVEFTRDFAPAENCVAPQEQPWRASVCLNGTWQFQPVAVPGDFKRDTGVPPELPPPRDEGWDKTPIKIPSPWNVNMWGCGRDVGTGTAHPLWPDSVYFPSYPVAWDRAEMGWLRRTFRIPAGWEGRRLVLHFEAVAGECRVLVNGKLAGTHFDKYLPFDFDITDLARRGGENELLVGVRAHRLFNQQSQRYPKMRAPYPCGSETEPLVGIWQDVFLLGLPPVRVSDVFVKPLVDRDTLELEVTLRNDSTSAQAVTVGGEVQPWLNLAGTNVLDAPEPKWRLAAAVLALPAGSVTMGAHATTQLVLCAKTGGALKRWAPGTPQLYAAVLAIQADGRQVDAKYTRFGWRQFAIRGKDLLLNSKPIKLTGDFLHPFGPFVMSRRYVWAWYKMIQDFGGNSVRPHAQPHPCHYLDLADEMGLVVLDETALFGSSIALNFEEPVAWRRFAEHYDGLVLRDRNHPSVLGWSFGNELFAIFEHNSPAKETADGWYRQLAELGARARRLDPTRDWISCDGDEDLRGTLPVWSKHFGHGTPLERLPDVNKPLMVGESGGTYYARPKQMAEFNGARAYESYAGRNEALAMDVWDNLVRMALPRLAYYSASETAWFGVEHQNFGYEDFDRLPCATDGVFFAKSPAEGKPGMQIERLPPYTATLNPGWDSTLPLYQPLAMFEAQKAALAPGGPQPCAWDHKPKAVPPPPAAPAPTIERVAFIGDDKGPLARRLTALGVPLTDGFSPPFTIVDADTLNDATAAAALRVFDHVRIHGGTMLWFMGQTNSTTARLPLSVRLIARKATALVPDAKHPWTAAFTLPDLYFAEDDAGRGLLRRGLAEPLSETAQVLLRASETDWAEFNTAPEKAKCAAVLLGEQLNKSSGAALVEDLITNCKLLLCTLDYRVSSRTVDGFWRRLFANAGIKLGAPAEAVTPAFDEHNALINALAIGRFGAATLEEALAKDFIGEATTRPVAGMRTGNLVWQPVTSPSRDRFVLHQMKQAGVENGAFALYFSCWLRSPRALDDLLADGPDAPRFSLFCYAAEQCRVFVNGRETAATRTEPADYRTRYTFGNVPLKKDWNHILIKVAASKLHGPTPATLAVRFASSSEAFLQQLESAVELKPAAK